VVQITSTIWVIVFGARERLWAFLFVLCFSEDVRKNGVAGSPSRRMIIQKHECKKCGKKFRITVSSESTSEV